MAVAFDAKPASDGVTNTPISSPLTLTFTIGAGATALVATTSMAITSGTCPTCSGMTWNGVAMTLLGTIVSSNGLFRSYLFGLASPATGSHTLSASFAGTFTNATAYLDAASFTGTDLTTANAFPSANVLTNASTPTGTTYPTAAFSVTTVSGDAALASMNCTAVGYTGVAAGTLLRADSTGNGNNTWGFHLAVGASTTMQFTGGSSGSPCTGVAIRIQQPQAAGNPFVTPDTSVPHKLFGSVQAAIGLNPNLFTNPFPLNQYDWSKPVRVASVPPRPESLNPNLFTNPIPILNLYDQSKPFRLPKAPYDVSVSLNPNLFTNPLPFNQTDWSKPLRVPQARVPIDQQLNINLFTNPYPFLNQFVPVSAVAKLPLVDAPYNPNLYTVTVVANPFIPIDFSVPTRVRSAPVLDATFNPNLFTNPIPFLNQFTPTVTVPALRPVDAPYNQNLYQVVITAQPFLNQFVPGFVLKALPQPDQSLNINLFTNPYPIQNVTTVLARSPAFPLLDQPYNLNLYGIVTGPIPFNTYDYPLPRRVAAAPFDLSQSLNPNVFTNPIPVLNFDWTPPRHIQPPPLDQSIGFQIQNIPVVAATLIQRTLTGVGL